MENRKYNWAVKVSTGQTYRTSADECRISKAGDISFWNKETSGSQDYLVCAYPSGAWHGVQVLNAWNGAYNGAELLEKQE